MPRLITEDVLYFFGVVAFGSYAAAAVVCVGGARSEAFLPCRRWQRQRAEVWRVEPI
jgi:hypothetical protein